tara:strand:+ start:116 stop:667 length:552 start_codon:yes stop_codon:yes gene_type:complete
MIQGLINNQTATAFSYAITWYVDIADKFVGTPTFTSSTIGDDTYYALSFPYILYKLESQQTGKTKIFTRSGFSPAVGKNLNKYKRQVTLSFEYSVNPSSTEDLSAAEILVGNDDFPLGFYNITVYETDTNGELNPDNAKAVLYNGILNMKGREALGTANDFQSVVYTEYTTNDADTDSVYITN